MADIRVINGIGTGLIRATPSGDAPQFEITLPLTMKDGYTEKWDDESFIQRFISLDIDDRTITEEQFVINGFCNWVFDYSGIPLPNSVIQDFVKLWNSRARYSYTLIPKSQAMIGLPDRQFEVNLIGADGLTFQTSDSPYAIGTFGVKLYFRTKVNSMINVGIATGILPGGGSYNAAYEGGM